MRAMLETEVIDLLEQANIKCLPYRIATNSEEAAAACEYLQTPLVMKILSPDILHKSDVGGVRIGLKDSESIAKAYNQMLTEVASKRSTAHLMGAILYPQVGDGLEIIIGVTQDVTFGPVIMFGLGGIFVEVIKDIVFRAIPISMTDAHQMIADLKNNQVLKGWRGYKAIDLDNLADLLYKVSQLISQHPEIKEMDLNPVRILEDGRMVVLDAKVIC